MCVSILGRVCSSGQAGGGGAPVGGVVLKRGGALFMHQVRAVGTQPGDDLSRKLPAIVRGETVGELEDRHGPEVRDTYLRCGVVHAS